MTLFITATIALILFCASTECRNTYPPPDNWLPGTLIHLASLSKLTFRSDRTVITKQGATVPEMRCGDSEYCYYPLTDDASMHIEVACSNDGYDEATQRYNWTCALIHRPTYVEEYEVDKAEVECDGAHNAHDQLVLRNTCRLRYALKKRPVERPTQASRHGAEEGVPPSAESLQHIVQSRAAAMASNEEIGRTIATFFRILLRGSITLIIGLAGAMMLCFLCRSMGDMYAPIAGPVKTKRASTTTAPKSSTGATAIASCVHEAPDKATVMTRDHITGLLYDMVLKQSPKIVLRHSGKDAKRCLRYLDAQQTQFVTKDDLAGSRHNRDGRWFLLDGASRFTPEGYRFLCELLRCAKTPSVGEHIRLNSALMTSFTRPLVLPLGRAHLIVSMPALNKGPPSLLCKAAPVINVWTECGQQQFLTLAPSHPDGAVDAVACRQFTQCDIAVEWDHRINTLCLYMGNASYKFAVETQGMADRISTVTNIGAPHFICCYRLKAHSIWDRLLVVGDV